MSIIVLDKTGSLFDGKVSCLEPGDKRHHQRNVYDMCVWSISKRQEDNGPTHYILF